MNDKVFETLEFHKIRKQLMNFASSALGKEMIEKLTPSVDFSEVVKRLAETDEAGKVLRLKGHVPLDGIFNISPSITRAEIGGILQMNEFVEISSTIRAGRHLKKFLGNITEEEELPILRELYERLNPPVELERKINRAINEHGEVLDSASEELRSLRSRIRTFEAKIREKLESMIRSAGVQKMLSDAIITIRNDRFVLPVKQEYRGHFGGIIHDESSSGQTLFIEPEPVVQLNNELHHAKIKEQIEIERILTVLSKDTGVYCPELREMTEILQKIDFMFAKAKYGQAIKGTKPEVNNKGLIRLFKARHPFIPEDEVVANDIELGTDFTTMVITGPNTGGKTVTLKTVGLIILMAQAGLPIPARDGSEVAVFQSVFADIGDEQSIEQSLSTFSSHMVNIVGILEHVDENSLVLFDELGAGTDPQEGAALAMSILDEVHNRGARVIATTHYPELKAYGYNREGVINASVEFDVETLRPTYRLLIGVPGRSNAFEISKRLGLAAHIIKRAKKQIHGESSKVDNMLASLEERTRLIEEEEKETREYLKLAEKTYQDLQRAMAEYYEMKDKLYERARQEAQNIVKKAEHEAEEIIKNLRKMQLEKSVEIKEHELIGAKKRLEEAVPEAKKKPAAKQAKKTYTFRPGDEVKVLSLNQKGDLIEKVSEDGWRVQIGILKMDVKEEDMEPTGSKPKVETKPLVTVKGKEYHVGLELDIRGERYEDAMMKVEKYIDDALLAGYQRVSIIHGKGTGALRTGVQNYLKKHPQVKSYRYADANEGGTGVTVVELK